jgi:hypothetical protein
MDKCPHCGSTDAFEYNITLVTSRIGEWGKDVDEEVRVESSVFPKTVKCGSCGKRVNFDLAHGVAVEQSVQRTAGKHPLAEVADQLDALANRVSSGIRRR